MDQVVPTDVWLRLFYWLPTKTLARTSMANRSLLQVGDNDIFWRQAYQEAYRDLPLEQKQDSIAGNQWKQKVQRLKTIEQGWLNALITQNVTSWNIPDARDVESATDANGNHYVATFSRDICHFWKGFSAQHLGSIPYKWGVATTRLKSGELRFAIGHENKVQLWDPATAVASTIEIPDIKRIWSLYTVWNNGHQRLLVVGEKACVACDPETATVIPGSTFDNHTFSTDVRSLCIVKAKNELVAAVVDSGKSLICWDPLNGLVSWRSNPKRSYSDNLQSVYSTNLGP